jgi:hypothetical protein
VWLDYETGLVSEPGCGDAVIPVVVPRGAPLEQMYGCWSPRFDQFTRRLRDWWRHLTD